MMARNVLGSMVLVGAVAALMGPAGALEAQMSSPLNDLPNPYESVDGWAQLPDGREWGSTAGVDIEIRRSMWEFLRAINAAGTTIILTTHYLEEAESLCRHVAIIDNGVIIEDAPMSTVLRKLQREVFVLSLAESVQTAPRLNGFETRLRDDGELEVEKGPAHSLNDLFAQLDERDIAVVSLRNKANRLEELFMRLVKSNQNGMNSAGEV